MADIQTLAENWIESRNDKDFRKLYDRLRPGLWKYLSRFESDFDERESLVSIVFAKAIDNIHQYDKSKGKFSTWLYRIAFTESLLEKNRRSRISSLDALEEEGFTVRDEAQEPSVDKSDIIFGLTREEAIDSLYKNVIEAYKNCGDEQIYKAHYKQHFEHKSMKEIGEELGICENTAKQKIFKGKKLIRNMLLKSNPELVEAYKEMI